MNCDVDVRRELSRLLGGQKLGVLSTHNDGQPYASLVAFAATENMDRLVFATTRATRKFSNMSADARAGMLIDNRSNEVADLEDAAAATATGATRELSGDEKTEMLALYLRKHPYLEEFASAPTCALMALDVDTYYVVNRFQHVEELHITSPAR